MLLTTLIILLVTLILLMALNAHRVATKSIKEDRVTKLAIFYNTLPANTVLIVSLSHLIIPVLGFKWTHTYLVSMWCHRFGIFLLLTFLLLGQYLQIEAWIKKYNGHTYESLYPNYALLRSINETMPASAAILILLTGLNLIYLDHSLHSGWLFILYTVFVVMFVDGWTHYLPHARKLESECLKACNGEPNAFVKTMNNWYSNISIFLHLLSIPFLAYLGHEKPAIEFPFVDFILETEDLLTSQGFEIELSRLLVTIAWGSLIISVVLLLRKLASNKKLREI